MHCEKHPNIFPQREFRTPKQAFDVWRLLKRTGGCFEHGHLSCCLKRPFFKSYARPRVDAEQDFWSLLGSYSSDAWHACCRACKYARLVTETSRIQSVLFCMQNRKAAPCLAAMHRIPAQVRTSIRAPICLVRKPSFMAARAFPPPSVASAAARHVWSAGGHFELQHWNEDPVNGCRTGTKRPSNVLSMSY
jgi:hypothetical protein